MDTGDNSTVGTKFKLNVTMEPVDGKYHLSNVDWEAEVYTKIGRSQIINKDNARRVDDDNYIIVVDSAIGGAGLYYLTLTAYIPDSDCEGGLRKEVATVSTMVKIDAR